MKFFTKRFLLKHSIKQSSYNNQLVSYVFDDVTRNILVKGNHEENIQKISINFLKKNKIKFENLIDCGAHIGTSSLNLKKDYAKIYSIEALEKSFQLLVMNTKDYEKIIPINASLSEKNETKELSFDKNFICGAGFNKNSEFKFTVQTTTLDELFKDKDLSNLSIKLDLEGHEFEVLKGAQKIINQYRPIVFVEINKNKIINGSSDVFNFLKNQKYRFFNAQPKNIMLIYFLRTKLYYFLSNFSFFNKLEIIEIKKLVSVYDLYPFLICVPEEKI